MRKLEASIIKRVHRINLESFFGLVLELVSERIRALEEKESEKIMDQASKGLI